MKLRIGIDTGGTSTDFVLFDDTTGAFTALKVSSAPRDPSLALPTRCYRPRAAQPCTTSVGTIRAARVGVPRDEPWPTMEDGT